MNTNAIQNTGNWDLIREHLDNLTRSRLFIVPTGPYPAVTIGTAGELVIQDPETGVYLDRVPVGDWLVLAFGGFIAVRNATTEGGHYRKHLLPKGPLDG